MNTTERTFTLRLTESEMETLGRALSFARREFLRSQLDITKKRGAEVRELAEKISFSKPD